MALTAGSRLGPYEIVAPIGAGGMGEVWRAKDPRLGRDVAIKVLPASFSADADRLRRFEQEARAAGILNHPNLTAVHDIGTHEGAPYVVQELLEGETLRSTLAGGKLSTRRATEYSLQIVHGLAAAHEKGIVHRDLKPENIFVTNDGRVKILDFGLAKLTLVEDKGQVTNLPTEAAGTEPGVVLGTLGYMSPEQVRGKPADARSDIFSFGAILYEMLAGRGAFHGDSAADTMSAILREDPPDLSVTNQSVPPGLDRIVRHCLEKSPEQRFHSAHDIAFDLETLSSMSQPGAAPALPALARRRLPGFLLAIPALALGLLAGFVLWKQKPATAPSFHRLTYRRGVVNGARLVADGQTAVYSARVGGRRLRILQQAARQRRGDPPGNEERRDRCDVAVGGDARPPRPPDGPPAMPGWAPSRERRSPAARRAICSRTSPPRISAPDGQTMAVVLAPNWRYRLEFPAGKTLYETAGWIGHVRISPHGDEVAILDHPQFGDDRGAVSLIDRAGQEDRSLGRLGERAGHRLVPRRDGDLVHGFRRGLGSPALGGEPVGQEAFHRRRARRDDAHGHLEGRAGSLSAWPAADRRARARGRRDARAGPLGHGLVEVSDPLERRQDDGLLGGGGGRGPRLLGLSREDGRLLHVDPPRRRGSHGDFLRREMGSRGARPVHSCRARPAADGSRASPGG